MIRFVDTNTGNVFNGNAPYIHWFEGAQSVGINYSKRFIVLSDSEQLDIRLKSEVFFLVDDTKLTDFKQMHHKQYLNLADITTDHIVLNGVAYENMYAFSFNVIAKGLYVGEITDQFTISDERFTIGADFCDENESLGVNLTNFGMELPTEIQRSIYVQNIHEQKPDYILLNRKFKELLNEYIGIIANKGSYKSLINSVKWFEYGDLVKIYEYWRHEEPTRKMLSKNDITQYVTDKLGHVLSAFQKTTYIGLSAALTNCVVENGEIQYLPEISGELHAEPLPLMENVATLWTRTEMSLKMVLLGNFFSTYFMPIHLDLIHCTIEDIVFSDTIKVAYIPKTERFDYVDNTPVMTCSVKPLHHLDVVDVYVNNDTPFGFINKDVFTDEDAALEICGVDLQYDNETDPEIQSKTLSAHFNNIGSVVPFTCRMFNLSENSFITTGKLYVYHEGELVLERYTDKLPKTAENGAVTLHFNLLVQLAGEYTVQLQFNRNDGSVYTKSVSFTVDGERYQNISMFKMVQRYISDDDYMTFNMEDWINIDNESTPLPFDNIADYVLDPVRNDYTRTYMQFFATSEQALKNVNLNQVIVVKKAGCKDDETPLDPEDINVRFDSNYGRKDISLADLVQDSYLGVRWFKTVKHQTVKVPDDKDVLVQMVGDLDTYYIGINVNAKYHILYSVSSKDADERCWITKAFVPYFYKLEKIGEVTVTEQMLKNMSAEEIYRLQNSPEAYTITKDEVVCFLPELRCIKRPGNFMWKFTNQSTNQVITPIAFRDERIYEDKYNIKPSDKISSKITKEFPTIVQPIFGRYDFSIIPQPGYYDVTLQYKLDENEPNQIREISSQFIVSK